VSSHYSCSFSQNCVDVSIIPIVGHKTGVCVWTLFLQFLTKVCGCVHYSYSRSQNGCVWTLFLQFDTKLGRCVHYSYSRSQNGYVSTLFLQFVTKLGTCVHCSCSLSQNWVGVPIIRNVIAGYTHEQPPTSRDSSNPL
jgi:hypothetical protein